MSRHRNIRKMNYNDECEGFDDVYGHSVDDDSSCISPTDSSQFLFDRDRGQQSMSAFLASHRDIQEENENETEVDFHNKKRRDSENFQFPQLNDDDTAKLRSCIDEIRNVVGESISEKQLVETIMKFNYDFTSALDAVLNTTITPPNRITEQVPVETVSKDLNKFNIKSLTKLVNSDNATTTNISDNSSTKFLSLSDLAKSHNKINTDNSVNVGSPKFVIPLFNRKIETETEPISKSFSSLSDFANYHLKTNSSETTTKFVLPKLSSSPIVSGILSGQLSETRKSVENLTPHQESLNKIMSLQKLNITEINSNNNNLNKTLISPLNTENLVIDLTSALTITDNTNLIIKNKEIKNKKNDDEIFIPHFIDCDIVPILEQQITHDCEIDISKIKYKKLFIKTVNCSKFGKTLCRNYRINKIPYVKHEFLKKNILKAFNFSVPSPDDVALKFLEKAKRK